MFGWGHMNKWTNEEIALLEDLYKNKTKFKDIAKIVNHPVSSVCDKACDLKLSCKYPNHSLKYEHDENFERLYRIFHHMKDRYDNQNHHEYHNYGEKGIKICDEWSNFDNFRNWALSNGYAKDLTIDRIDSDKGYSPDNCQWITRSKNTAKSNKTQHRKSDLGDYIAIDPNGTTIIFCNANKFGKENGLSPSIIRDKARDINSKPYKGWVFSHVNMGRI